MRRTAAGVAALLAVAAFGGAAGLVSGGVSLGATITGRLPFASPVFAGLALAVVVGLPAVVAAVAASRGLPAAGYVVLAAGVLLVGWIGVQIAVIRTVVWLHPVFAIWGVSLAVLGVRLRQSEATSSGST